MKKNKFVVMLALACALLILPIPTYAAESYSTESREGSTRLVFVPNGSVYSYAPYVSNNFRPTENHVQFLFGSWGTHSASYTYSMEALTSNGTWIVVESVTLGGGSSSGRGVDVTPGNVYRVKATTTDPYPNGVYLEVFEQTSN